MGFEVRAGRKVRNVTLRQGMMFSLTGSPVGAVFATCLPRDEVDPVMSAEQAAKDPACGQSVGVGIGSLFAFLSAIEPLKPRDIAVRSSLSPPLAHTRLALGGLGPKVVLMRVGHKQVTSNTRAGTVYSIRGRCVGDGPVGQGRDRPSAHS